MEKRIAQLNQKKIAWTHLLITQGGANIRQSINKLYIQATTLNFWKLKILFPQQISELSTMLINSLHIAEWTEIKSLDAVQTSIYSK